MQTRTYADLFELVSALCGVTFATIEEPRIRALMNRRAVRAFKSSNYWTRFIKIGEERRLSGDSAAVTTTVSGSSYYINTVGNTDFSAIGVPYNAVFDGAINGTTLTVSDMTSGLIAIGDFITDGGALDNVQITAFITGTGGVGTYTVSPNQGTVAVTIMGTFTVDTYFTATGAGTGTGTVSPALDYLPYTQTGLNTIDSFLRVFVYAPFKTMGSQEYQYTVGSDGAELISGTVSPSSAFVAYKSVLTFSTAAGATSQSLTSSSLIPEEWFEYIAHGTYADYLRAEGQQEKAAVADAEASEILLDELMRLDEQHTQTLISNRMFTNSNMQVRW